MGKERFEQWIYDHAFVEIKHFHGDNGIFSSEEYRDDCADKMQLQSFSGVGAQHQNSKAERAIQTINVFDDLFESVFSSGPNDAVVDAICEDLYKTSRDVYATDEYDAHDNLVYKPPPLDKVWLDAEGRE